MHSPSTRLQVTPFASADDYGRMVEYCLTADEPFVPGMGVAPNKLPERSAWLEQIGLDIAT